MPTWQDVKDLATEPSHDGLGRNLDDPQVSSAVLFLTPEVKDSPTIQHLELPKILNRYDKKDAFFVTPVAAGGLDYSTVKDVAPPTAGIHDITHWNIKRASDPITVDECKTIAQAVQTQRMAKIDEALKADDPFTICLDAKAPGPTPGPWGLHFDWRHIYDGGPDVWRTRLIPPIRSARARMPQRKIVATGSPSLPAAFLLGAAFLEPSRPQLEWQQHNRGGSSAAWSLNVERKDSGFQVASQNDDLNGTALAVLVSVSDAVESAFNLFKSGRGYRGFVRISPSTLPATLDPGTGLDVARQTIEAIRAARREWPQLQRIDMFLSGPAGLAVLIGQLTNTLPPIQTFELVYPSGAGTYQEAALIKPRLAD